MIRFMAVVLGIGSLVAAAPGGGAGGPKAPPGLDEAQLAGWQADVDLDSASCRGAAHEGRRSEPPLIARSAPPRKLIEAVSSQSVAPM
jgi:hypothetical protein